MSGYFTCVSNQCGTSLTSGKWVFNPATLVSAADADYLAGGAWLIVPDRVEDDDDYKVGAYAQGRGTPWTQSQLSALRGHAHYRGKAFGLLARSPAANTDPYEIRRFSGNARLTASFHSRGIPTTLEGDISSIDIVGLGYQPNFNRISLLETDFSSGGFSGTARSTYGQSEDTDVADYPTGKWGARFYGRPQGEGRVPSSVAGTFTVTGKVLGLADFDSASFIGAFGGNETHAK